MRFDGPPSDLDGAIRRLTADETARLAADHGPQLSQHDPLNGRSDYDAITAPPAAHIHRHEHFHEHDRHRHAHSHVHGELGWRHAHSSALTESSREQHR